MPIVLEMCLAVQAQTLVTLVTTQNLNGQVLAAGALLGVCPIVVLCGVDLV